MENIGKETRKPQASFTAAQSSPRRTFPFDSRRHPFSLLGLSRVNLGFLALVYLLSEYIGEAARLTTLLTYCPPVLFVLPLFPLWFIALKRRSLPSLRCNLLATVFALTALMGMHVPLPALPALSPSDGSAQASSLPALRVMTYNIQHGGTGVESVAAAIRSLKPDVACLQEVNAIDIDPYVQLQAALPEYRIERVNEIAMAVKRSLPVRAVRPHRLIPLSPEEEAQATWLAARILYLDALEVEVEVEGQPVSLVSAHLMTPLYTRFRRLGEQSSLDAQEQTAAIRSQQIQGLLQVGAAISHPLIVCGDFNTPPRGLLYRRLTHRWQDAFSACGLGYGYTYPAKYPVLRIDHIFTANGAQAKSITQPAIRATDHRPVVAEITFPH